MSMRPRGRIARLGVLVALCALAAAHGVTGAAAAPEISIRTMREGDFVSVSATALMQVDPRVAWEVLSDYDGLARFIPGLKSSRVIARNGNEVRVEQKGEIGFFFYRQPVDTVLEVLEEPQRRITARAVAGKIHNLESHYALHAAASGLKLDYAGRFDPEFPLPPLIGIPIVGSLIERQFRALVGEIVRRDGLARGTPGQ